MRKQLESLGYTVLMAGNGQEAVDIVRAFEGEIHLTILDMAMPTMTGAQALPLLKELRPDMRFIVCSGTDNRPQAQQLLDAGANALMQKPFRAGALGGQVRSVLAPP